MKSGEESISFTHLLDNRDEDLVPLAKLCQHATKCIHGNLSELRGVVDDLIGVHLQVKSQLMLALDRGN